MSEIPDTSQKIDCLPPKLRFFISSYYHSIQRQKWRPIEKLLKIELFRGKIKKTSKKFSIFFFRKKLSNFTLILNHGYFTHYRNF